jgi:hypothetical protein
MLETMMDEDKKKREGLSCDGRMVVYKNSAG